MKYNLKAAALVLCLAAAGTLPAKAQTVAQPLENHLTSYKAAVKEFGDHLYKMAADKALAEGYRMPYTVKTSLQNLIGGGVGKMFSAGLTEEKYTRQAEDNLVRFVTVMIDDAKSRGIGNMLDMISFRNAQGMICPSGWPFC
jgi:hypothetical protein